MIQWLFGNIFSFPFPIGKCGCYLIIMYSPADLCQASWQRFAGECLMVRAREYQPPLAHNLVSLVSE